MPFKGVVKWNLAYDGETFGIIDSGGVNAFFHGTVIAKGTKVSFELHVITRIGGEKYLIARDVKTIGMFDFTSYRTLSGEVFATGSEGEEVVLHCGTRPPKKPPPTKDAPKSLPRTEELETLPATLIEKSSERAPLPLRLKQGAVNFNMLTEQQGMEVVTQKLIVDSLIDQLHQDLRVLPEMRVVVNARVVGGGNGDIVLGIKLAKYLRKRLPANVGMAICTPPDECSEEAQREAQGRLSLNPRDLESAKIVDMLRHYAGMTRFLFGPLPEERRIGTVKSDDGFVFTDDPSIQGPTVIHYFHLGAAEAFALYIKDAVVFNVPDQELQRPFASPVLSKNATQYWTGIFEAGYSEQILGIYMGGAHPAQVNAIGLYPGSLGICVSEEERKAKPEAVLEENDPTLLKLLMDRDARRYFAYNHMPRVSVAYIRCVLELEARQKKRKPIDIFLKFNGQVLDVQKRPSQTVKEDLPLPAMLETWEVLENLKSMGAGTILRVRKGRSGYEAEEIWRDRTPWKREGEPIEIRFIDPFPIAQPSMEAMLAISEPFTLATGDQSCFEALSANKIVFYEQFSHKTPLYLELIDLAQIVAPDGVLVQYLKSIRHLQIRHDTIEGGRFLPVGFKPGYCVRFMQGPGLANEFEALSKLIQEEYRVNDRIAWKARRLLNRRQLDDEYVDLKRAIAAMESCLMDPVNTKLRFVWDGEGSRAMINGLECLAELVYQNGRTVLLDSMVQTRREGTLRNDREYNQTYLTRSKTAWRRTSAELYAWLKEQLTAFKSRGAKEIDAETARMFASRWFSSGPGSEFPQTTPTETAELLKLAAEVDFTQLLSSEPSKKSDTTTVNPFWEKLPGKVESSILGGRNSYVMDGRFYRAKPNNGKGDCLFLSISDLLHADGVERDHAVLRLQAVTHLMEIRYGRPCEHVVAFDQFGGTLERPVSLADFRELLDGSFQHHRDGWPLVCYLDWQFYEQWMGFTGAWGDFIMLAVISHLFQKRIRVLVREGAPFVMEVCSTMNPAGGTWRLVNHGNMHFEALMEAPPFTDLDIGPKTHFLKDSEIGCPSFLYKHPTGFEVEDHNACYALLISVVEKWLSDQAGKPVTLGKPIGEGRMRWVFDHPLDPRLVIKIYDPSRLQTCSKPFANRAQETGHHIQKEMAVQEFLTRSDFLLAKVIHQPGLAEHGIILQPKVKGREFFTVYRPKERTPERCHGFFGRVKELDIAIMESLQSDERNKNSFLTSMTISNGLYVPEEDPTQRPDFDWSTFNRKTHISVALNAALDYGLGNIIVTEDNEIVWIDW